MEEKLLRKFLVILCFTLLVSIVVPFGQAPKASTTFTDVGSTHRAQAEIYYLVQKGVVSGVTSTKFAPDREVTRAEAAAMLGRALGLSNAKKATEFSDVPKQHGFSGYIQNLVDQGVISGYGDGTFKPDVTLTRGQMALLISRAFNFDSGSVSSATSSLMDKGIALGVADGTFGEANKIKRADFAVFIARSMNDDFRVAESERFTKKMYVNVGSNDTLNVRSGPGTSYSSNGSLTTGTVVLVSTTNNSWSHIKVGNYVGYVHSAYLQTAYVAPPTPPTKPGEKALKDLVIIIDPGHGGSDPGASGNGLVEKNVVLNIGRKMEKYYDKTPMQAKLTRNGDTFPTLDQRAVYAQKVNGDIFVSIHANAFNGSANGQETFYSQTAAVNPNANQSRALAIYTQHRMQEAWNLSNRGVKGSTIPST